jgi:hypothetical protein
MAIQIPADKISFAKHAEGWNMCLWGNPKITVICGKCYGEFKTRSYHPFTEGGVIANCPHCSQWNRFNF